MVVPRLSKTEHADEGYDSPHMSRALGDDDVAKLRLSALSGGGLEAVQELEQPCDHDDPPLEPSLSPPADAKLVYFECPPKDIDVSVESCKEPVYSVPMRPKRDGTMKSHSGATTSPVGRAQRLAISLDSSMLNTNEAQLPSLPPRVHRRRPVSLDGANLSKQTILRLKRTSLCTGENRRKQCTSVANDVVRKELEAELEMAVEHEMWLTKRLSLLESTSPE